MQSQWPQEFGLIWKDRSRVRSRLITKGPRQFAYPKEPTTTRFYAIAYPRVKNDALIGVRYTYHSIRQHRVIWKKEITKKRGMFTCGFVFFRSFLFAFEIISFCDILDNYLTSLARIHRHFIKKLRLFKKIKELADEGTGQWTLNEGARIWIFQCPLYCSTVVTLSPFTCDLLL